MILGDGDGMSVVCLEGGRGMEVHVAASHPEKKGGL